VNQLTGWRDSAVTPSRGRITAHKWGEKHTRRTAVAALAAAITAAPAAASTVVVEQPVGNFGITGWSPDVTAYFG
jgi:hypothetical protein